MKFFAVSAALVGCAIATSAAAAPFCVVASFGTQCVYNDVPSCQQAAAQVRGACVVQQESAGPRAGFPITNQQPQMLVGGPQTSPVDNMRALAALQAEQAQAQILQAQAQQAQQHAQQCRNARADALAGGDADMARRVAALCP